MRKSYCEYCGEKVKYTVVKEPKKIDVLGVEVEAIIKKAICSECGRAINVKKITKQNEQSVYDAYDKAKED